MIAFTTLKGGATSRINIIETVWAFIAFLLFIAYFIYLHFISIDLLVVVSIFSMAMCPWTRDPDFPVGTSSTLTEVLAMR